MIGLFALMCLSQMGLSIPPDLIPVGRPVAALSGGTIGAGLDWQLAVDLSGRYVYSWKTRYDFETGTASPLLLCSNYDTSGNTVFRLLLGSDLPTGCEERSFFRVFYANGDKVGLYAEHIHSQEGARVAVTVGGPP